MSYVVCYDIGDDKRRSKAARVLLGFGSRVQESVFECELDEARLRRLEDRLLEELELSVDSLRIYRLCAACRRLVMIHGAGPSSGPADVVVV